jgi:hypothetical protein
MGVHVNTPCKTRVLAVELELLNLEIGVVECAGECCSSGGSVDRPKGGGGVQFTGDLNL